MNSSFGVRIGASLLFALVGGLFGLFIGIGMDFLSLTDIGFVNGLLAGYFFVSCYFKTDSKCGLTLKVVKGVLIGSLTGAVAGLITGIPLIVFITTGPHRVSVGDCCLTALIVGACPGAALGIISMFIIEQSRRRRVC